MSAAARSTDRRKATSTAPASSTRMATNGSAMRVMSEPKMEIVRPVQKRTNAPLFHIGDVGRRTVGQHTRARRVRERAVHS